MSLHRSDCLCSVHSAARSGDLTGRARAAASLSRTADGSSLPQSAQATSGNLGLWRQKIGPSRAESPSSDQMKRSWLGPDRLGDSFVVRRLVSRSVSLGCSEMIGTYLRSARTADERYGVPRPTCARGWVASWRRCSSAARSSQTAAFSSHLAFSATYIQYRYRYRYICTRISRAMSHHTRSVGRSVV